MASFLSLLTGSFSTPRGSELVALLRPGMVVADVNQGVVGIRHWTAVDPDPAVMRRALEDL